jgi:glycosyltransferase involved in cell wall biosynthesis
MKILVVIESLGFGGAERLLVTLLPELKIRGIECDIAVLAGPYTLGRELECAGLRVFPLDIRHRWSMFEALWKLCKLARHENYDAIWGHLYFGNLYALITGVLAGIQTKVMTLHSPIYMDNRPHRTWDHIRLILENMLGNKLATKIVAVSNATAQDYISNFGWKNIEVVHNAIPIKNLPKPINEEDRIRVRKLYGIGQNDLMLVTAARYSIEKGHGVLIDALEKFRDQYGWSPHWIAASHGSLRGELERKASRLKLSSTISLLEALPQHDLFRLIQSSDIFILPSIREPFGIAAGEAMALGIPCILSEIDGLCELAGTGDAAVATMVPVGNSEALCKAIWEVYSNGFIREKKVKAGLSRMSNLFDTPSIAEKWCSVFNSCFVRIAD